ncbi:response regulator [Mucilaginibacter sp.]
MPPDRKLLTACIIDDDEIYVFGFKKVLTKKHIHPQLIDFQNGLDAIEFLSDPANAAHLPDVIFLDINMPVMDGWDFAEAFAQIEPNLEKSIAIYMVSSSINPNDIMRAKNIPFITDYMIKPIDEDVLVNILHTGATA